MKQEFDTLNPKVKGHKVRNSNVKRYGCKACIKFRKEDKRYVVYKFEERHNHTLYNNDDKQFARSRRQLKYMDYRNIYNATGSAIGGSRSHNIQTALKGGLEYVGATNVDYENAWGDMIAFVGNKDAQMLINLLSKRKNTVPEFFFSTCVGMKSCKRFFGRMRFLVGTTKSLVILFRLMPRIVRIGTR